MNKFCKKLFIISSWYFQLTNVNKCILIIKCYQNNYDVLFETLILYFTNDLDQGCQTQFLEGRSPAEFCSNPAPTHILCSFSIKTEGLD